ncbi:MAG TPA: alpha/beta fold hydrolase, partial [Chitinophagaceae bacterium]|nr:alpha/beta fold hydrolase [Chitinophagaceae bacterium]
TAVYKDLIDSGYKVITLDMRGNGKSDKPHEVEAYANDAEAKDIMGLVNMLHLNNYNLIGYSRGSIITARLLVLDKSISKAVMGGMGADFTNPEWPRRQMFYRALIGDTVKELEGVIKYVKKAGLDQLALAYLQKEQPSTSKEALNKVKQPVLIICGDKDTDNGSA